MPTQTTAPSWTWQEPPSSRAPIRVPVTLARWRVGTPQPGDRDTTAAEEAADILGMDVAAETCPDRDGIAADFAARIAARDLTPYCGIRLWEHSRPGFPVVTAWAYTLPVYHPILDPHQVRPDDTSTGLHEWALTAAREVRDADRDRHTADPCALRVAWTFRVHPETLRDLVVRDEAAHLAHCQARVRAVEAAARASDWASWNPSPLHTPPPRPILTMADSGDWTVHGLPLQVTARVQAGMLHAHQVLPVGGAS